VFDLFELLLKQNSFVVNSKSINSERCQKILSNAYIAFHSLISVMRNKLKKKSDSKDLEKLIANFKKSLSNKLKLKFSVVEQKFEEDLESINSSLIQSNNENVNLKREIEKLKNALFECESNLGFN